METSPLLLFAGLFAASWVGGSVLYQVATAARQSGMFALPIPPYRAGTQRAITALEVRAAQQIHRQVMARRPVSSLPDDFGLEDPDEYVDLRPIWARVLGFVVDLLFIAAVFFLFRALLDTSSVLLFAVAGYMALGVLVFFYQVAVQGEIGAFGYHFRFLLSLVAWPWLLTIR